MDRRVNAVEDSMNNAASLEYVQNLETRIIALERAMNELLGEERFSADMTNASDMPLTAAAATTGSASGFGVQRPSVDGGLNGADVRFRNDNPYPFYVGFSPGIVSTSGGVYFGAQVGYDGIVGPVGAVTRLTFNSAADELRLSFDATVRVQAFDEKLELYGGMGPGFTFRPSGTSFLFEVPFGAEYLVTEQVGVFMQLTTSYAFKPINQVDSSLSTGINLRF